MAQMTNSSWDLGVIMQFSDNGKEGEGGIDSQSLIVLALIVGIVSMDR